MGLTQVSTDGVKNDAITKTKIPANQIEASELADNAVDTNAIQDDAVITSKIADDAITTAQIANNAVSSGQINDNAVGSNQITSDAVVTSKIASGAITNNRLADQAVSLDKLSHGTSSNDGKFLRANNGADPTFETVNTDLVSDSSPQLGGALDSNGNKISMGTDDRIEIGDSGNLQIWRSSNNNSYIRNSGGTLYLDAQTDGTNVWITSNSQSEYMAKFNGNGAVELFYGGQASSKLQTLTDGVNITGTLKVNGSAFSASGGLMGITVITSVGTSTWTKPSGCNSVRVIVTGGGGGAGGNGETSNDIGAAGGAGGTAIEFIDVSGVSSVSVTVGNYGNGGSGSSNGSSGSTSSFGSYCSATGGGGGIQGNFGANKGGAGGSGSGGDMNITGGDGGNGYDNSGWSTQYGGTPHLGGASFWGGGANGGIHNSAPSVATTYGSGGAGGMRDNQSAGSRGMSGVVYIEEYT